MDNSEARIDGTCQVRISEDEMSAWITLTSPKNGGQPVSLELVDRALENNRVTTNINRLAVEQTVFLKIWDRPQLVASGTLPEDGQDGYIEYYFPILQDIIPKVNEENGSVDFRNLNLIHNVKKGDLLAERFPAQEGKNGQTVTGKVIYAAKLNNPVLLGGKDTTLEPSGARLVAAKDGHVSMVDGKPTVISLYVVKSDVDFSVGNIEIGRAHV